MRNISFLRSEDMRDKFNSRVKELIVKTHSNKVCDIGGGANPLLSKEYIIHNSLNYVLLDISESELNKAPASYSKLVADISAENFDVQEQFDFCFSRMVAEHIKNGEQLHRNVLKILKRGGIVIHIFPTLFALPFLVNRILSQNVGLFVLNKILFRGKTNRRKFPAYYSWCYGPTKRQMRRFEDLGYNIIEYVGGFGHSGYYKYISLLRKLHMIKTNYLIKYPNPWLTSYSYIVLEKA